MRNPSLHRYATRPGLYLTDDGGADVIVWSETAQRMWVSVIEDLHEPSVYYDIATPLAQGHTLALPESLRLYPVAVREVPAVGLRETLFAMQGPEYGMWSVHIPYLKDGMRYGIRADGAWNPKRGVQFNPYKILLDPCGKGIDGQMQLVPEAFSYECSIDAQGNISGSAYGPMSKLDSLGFVPLSVVIDDRDEHKHAGDPEHPHVPWSTTILYELHVKGFTQTAPWLPEELRGTYAGLAHPQTITYLQRLGITSVELLPIFAKQTEVAVAQRGLTNYWGYSTLGYFAPEPSYATARAQRAGAQAVRQEVIDMVRALHEAGIEVILDVVYNHTCESGNEGPTVCWRGLDSASYYRRQSNNPGALLDTTGCGNTLDFSNTRVISYAIDSLRYWAKRIGVDGFRFDLAASLARLDGQFSKHHPFLYELRTDMVLGNLKMIMEPWDLGESGWRTGQFGIPFAEWNDKFRDATRTFWLTDIHNLDTGLQPHVGMQEIATRLCGSADLFATDPGRGAVASINIVACHDGMTLGDLTRYSHKHNEANGENGLDGSDNNHATNFGVEGPSTDPAVNTRRQRAQLNLLGMMLMSLGTPMLLAGDEFGNTQFGNNNAYAQDNEISWLDWSWYHADETTCEHQSAQMHQLLAVRKLIALRKTIEQYQHEEFFTLLSLLGLLKPSSRVQWYLPDGTTPMERDWFDHHVRAFSMRLASKHRKDVIIVVNGTIEDLNMKLPDDCRWRLLWSSSDQEPSCPLNTESWLMHQDSIALFIVE